MFMVSQGWVMLLLDVFQGNRRRLEVVLDCHQISANPRYVNSKGALEQTRLEVGVLRPGLLETSSLQN